MGAVYKDIITFDSTKRSSKPTVRNLRITVYDILSYLASGMTQEQILHDFPELTQKDILACLEYAAEREHKTVVE